MAMEEEGVDSQLSCTSSEYQYPILMPSRVGREFVRQYYRLLQKAPELVHRFYKNDSTCTHGDFEMALGKRDIQSLFLRENYMNCNTKITHLDIHGTLVNSVVVLVTGEQSNAGYPMRPFVQTFVLAAHGPRRYYVCNDIFRYTDAIGTSAHSVSDVECQTSIQHIGDGDQQYYYQQQNNSQKENEEQTTSENDMITGISTVKANETAADMESNIGRMHLPENCAIPMPRWANNTINSNNNSSKNNNITTNNNTTTIITTTSTNSNNNINNSNKTSNNSNSQHHQQQQQQLQQQQQQHQHKDIKLKKLSQHNGIDQSIYKCDDKNIANDITMEKPYIEQGQAQQQQEYPLYRSLIAQALSPNVDFEDFHALNRTYERTALYTEDRTRVSIGVSSEHALRSPENMLAIPSLQNRESGENLMNYQQQNDDSNQEFGESREKMPTYAKLLMSAFTRASLKNNLNRKMSTNNSNIASPLRATGMHPFNNENNSNNGNIENMTNAQSQLPPSVSILNEHNDSSYEAANAEGFFQVQRANNTANLVRRNDRRRASSAQKYHDNQQLFLGQIPHNATEEELVSIFSCFGNVLELRILPNLGGKIQPGAKHPLKYGFLTFEHVESVKACLESRPVYFPNNSPDGQKLNVRAKKPSVSREEIQPSCQSMDSQSMSNDWLKATTRRNNSVSHNMVGGGGGGVGVGVSVSGSGSASAGANTGGNLIFNRKDNRHNRGASLDSGSQMQGGKKYVQVAATNSHGPCGHR